MRKKLNEYRIGPVTGYTKHSQLCGEMMNDSTITISRSKEFFYINFNKNLIDIKLTIEQAREIAQYFMEQLHG